MEGNENVLGGFTAMFDEMNSNLNIVDNDLTLKKVDDLIDQEPIKVDDRRTKKDDDKIDKDEYDEMFHIDKDDDFTDITKEPKKQFVKNPQATAEADSQAEVVSGLFDVFAEQYGWELDEGEEKPSKIEDLLEFVDTYIENKNQPNYSSVEIQQLDEYVRNGGSIHDFLERTSGVDYSQLDLSKESNQRLVVKEFLRKQGLSETQIERKVNKYEEAGILDDEAEESLEILQKITADEKQALLEEQKKFKEDSEKQQKEFMTNVLDTVKALKDIRGISIPEREKKELLEYMFKPLSSGRTQYQEDYSTNILNLVESAYFTKNKAKLLDAAKKAGETTAVERFKNKLKNNTPTGGTRRISSSSGKAIWDLL